MRGLFHHPRIRTAQQSNLRFQDRAQGRLLRVNRSSFRPITRTFGFGRRVTEQLGKDSHRKAGRAGPKTIDYSGEIPTRNFGVGVGACGCETLTERVSKTIAQCIFRDAVSVRENPPVANATPPGGNVLGLRLATCLEAIGDTDAITRDFDDLDHAERLRARV